MLTPATNQIAAHICMQILQTVSILGPFQRRGICGHRLEVQQKNGITRHCTRSASLCGGTLRRALCCLEADFPQNSCRLCRAEFCHRVPLRQWNSSLPTPRRVLLYICPCNTLYASHYYCMCPHTTMYVSSYYCICVLILLYMSMRLLQNLMQCYITLPVWQFILFESSAWK